MHSNPLPLLGIGTPQIFLVSLSSIYINLGVLIRKGVNDASYLVKMDVELKQGMRSPSEVAVMV